MSRSREVRTTFPFLVHETQMIATISGVYHPAQPDTYDASRGGPGGWDPGHSEFVEDARIERIEVEGQHADVVFEIPSWLPPMLTEGGDLDRELIAAAHDAYEREDSHYDAMREDRGDAIRRGEDP